MTSKTGGEIHLKLENMQLTGSFKFRGAFNKMSQLTNQEKERGVIACSAGNHAQGIALSAHLLGIKSKIVMPISAPQAKVDATKGYGSEVVYMVKPLMMRRQNVRRLLEKQVKHTYIHMTM